MAKKKQTKKILVHINERNVSERNIFEYAKELMLIFGANVNIARSIPDGRDGLKPVERRSLYGMKVFLRMKPGESNKKKLARVVGEVMGQLHPHGDTAIEDTICAMGQWWNTPIPLVQKHGNFGSVKGDSHAAARYIEVELCKFSDENFFGEWSPNITEFMPTYTGEHMEPEYLPSAMPIILCKNIFGMGYGASTGIPFFCPDEVIDLTIDLIKNPKKKKVVLIPDSPTGCPIVEADWETICSTGYGSFRYRGEAEIDENNDIIIKSIPHTTSTTAIISKIKSLVLENKLDGIEDMIDDTDEDADSASVRIIINIKKGFSAEQILDTIYKATELQTAFAVKLDVVYDFENFHVSLRSLILNWIEFRRETKRRFAANNYSNIRKQVHLLEAIVTILDKKGGYEELVKIGSKSRNRTDMIEKLISKFKLTDIQAEALADMRLYKISIENKENYKSDLKKAKQMEKEVKSILEDDEGLDKIIIDELKYFKKQYCFGRRSEIISCSDINEIPESKHIIALTKQGFVKKLDINYSGIGDIEQGDYITQLFKANNTDELLVFDSLGTAYSIPVFSIENTGKKKGIKIEKLIKIPSKAEVVSIIVKPTAKEIENSDKMLYLAFVTKDGIVKKSLLKYYIGAGASGIIGINLGDNDKLVSVISMKGDKNIILYTQHGKYIKYNTEEISETKRVSKGVIGIKLAKDDVVVGLEALSKNKNYVVILTNKGNGKKCLLRNFDVSKRGTAGNQLIKLGSNEEIRVVMSARSANSIDIYTYEDVLELNVEDIPEMLKITPGKKILKLGRKNDILKAVLK